MNRTTRRLWPLAPLALAALGGCLSLPPPSAPEKSPAGAVAPSFSLSRALVTATPDGEQQAAAPGTTSLAELTSGTAVVLVFYRGHW